MKKFCYLVILLFTLVGIHPSVAQGEPIDPLKKPKIWSQLESNPSNEAIWIAYFGKDLFDLSDEEYQNFTKWKAELMKARESKTTQTTQKTIEQKKDEYLKKVYGEIKDPYYQSLVSNISSNFLMIEEYFNEQFAFYNQEYIHYNQKHPKGNFDKEEWIQEQESKLKKLKKEQ